MISFLGSVSRLFARKKGKVYVGLSGGVDSSVSAALLKQEGYDVVGVFIKIAIEGYPCPAAQDRRSAMRAAAHLGIPFIEIDLSEEYTKKVFDLSIQEFARGKTPNPDTLCNREIKFGLFFDFAVQSGADYIATGHYAQVKNEQLFEGNDPSKDQSYFLWAVPETQLKKTLFPVGHMQKQEVRKRAKAFHLPNAKRPDSQGLCFLGDISIQDMLVRELETTSGNVLDAKGEIVGTHDGAVLYTLGQRHGFTLTKQSEHTKPHFVVAKDIGKNTITVSEHPYPKNASRTRLKLVDCNWIGEKKAAHEKVWARYRYHQKLIPAEIVSLGDTSEILLLEAHYAPEGQSLVLYEDGRALGGGVIYAVYLEDNAHH